MYKSGPRSVFLVILTVIYVAPLYALFFYAWLVADFQRLDFVGPLISVIAGNKDNTVLFVRLIMPLLMALASAGAGSRILSWKNTTLSLIFVSSLLMAYVLGVVVLDPGVAQRIDNRVDGAAQGVQAYLSSLQDAMITSLAVLLGVSLGAATTAGQPAEKSNDKVEPQAAKVDEPEKPAREGKTRAANGAKPAKAKAI